MFTDRMDFTSLCYISEEFDNNGKPWLKRIADVEDGRLVLPRKSTRPTRCFENRDRIYKWDGPDQIGEIGVWDWFTSPGRKPDTDRVESYYDPELRPIRVITLPDISEPKLLMEALSTGIPIKHPVHCDMFFCYCYEQKWGKYEDKFQGLFCRAEDLTIMNGTARLKADIPSLPQYSFSKEDIYIWTDNNLRLLKYFNLTEPEGYVTVKSVDEIIRSIILSRVTWRTYRDTINGTKREWYNCKLLLERICAESLYETVATELKCSLDDAKKSVDKFTEHAGFWIDQGDIDSEILAQIVTYHDGLRAKCEEIAAAQWRQGHQAEISDAQNELNKVSQQRLQVEKEIQSLQEQVISAQSQLDKLKSEAARYEALGNDALKAVQTKISAAQNDVAEFIAELSMFMPQPVPVSSDRQTEWKYTPGSANGYEKDDFEVNESWDDELSLLEGNLQSVLSVDDGLCCLLSAFLYAAYIQNVPLLIAGPCSLEFANALSASVSGKTAGVLTLSADTDMALIGEIAENTDKVIAVQNVFCKDWNTISLQSLTQIKKPVIWTHPYVEDLIIEPKGLYNYVLPIFTECFVEAPPKGGFVPGIKSDKFSPYTPAEKLQIRIKAVNQLGLSKLLLNRLQRIMSDAANMLGIDSGDMEFLFAMLPLAVLTGQTERLQEALEAEKNISDSVKKEIKRYLEED